MPGIGKSTVIRRVAARLRDQTLGGFYTEELRTRGQRMGFRLISFAGLEVVIAHVARSHAHRVGKYGVDVAAIDSAAQDTLKIEAATDVYCVDEIGKMECMSSHFVAAMRALLGSPKPVVATIGKKGGGFMDEVKQRKDAELWEITHHNRDPMPDRVLDWLAEHLPR